ncbi:MAG TPA: recombination mediator RecR [Cryomorphaceae bacterium]|nr:recombination mediator RecR [Cryomorphaceae bacterium]
MIPSKYIENAVNEMASLQGVGRRTALRYVLELINRSDADIERFAKALLELKTHVHICSICHNLSDEEVCTICRSPSRDQKTICVVEDIRDVMAIESTGQYQALYHVLNGKISPIDGVGPSDLNVGSLLSRMNERPVEEVILALSPTMEGDTTSFYLFKKLSAFEGLKITTLSRGVAVGDELRHADEITLGRSILHRTPYHGSLQ